MLIQYIHAYELKNELHTHYCTCHAKNLLCLAFLLLLGYSEKIRHGSYRFDDLLFKDFSRTFQGLLTIFKESVSTGTISHFFHSHSKKAIPVNANNVVQPKDKIV